jgi:hypothetical protein
MLDSHYICGIAMLGWHHNVELLCLDGICMQVIMLDDATY